MKNWKTSLLGLAAAAGFAMTTSDNPTVALVGKVLAALGTGGGLMAAKDHNVTGK